MGYIWIGLFWLGPDWILTRLWPILDSISRKKKGKLGVFLPFLAILWWPLWFYYSGAYLCLICDIGKFPRLLLGCHWWVMCRGYIGRLRVGSPLSGRLWCLNFWGYFALIFGICVFIWLFCGCCGLLLPFWTLWSIWIWWTLWIVMILLIWDANIHHSLVVVFVVLMYCWYSVDVMLI